MQHLDVESRKNLLEERLLEASKGFFEALISWLPYSQSAVLPEAKLENLFWRRIPPKYRQIQAQTDSRLQTYVLNRLKELAGSGQLDKIVEDHQLFELIRLISSPVIWDFFKQEIHPKPRLEGLWNWVDSWGFSEKTPIKGGRISASGAQPNPRLEQILLDWVERSKTEGMQEIAGNTLSIEEVQKIAANALTILVKAGIDLSGHDFNKIRVPAADLSQGWFNNTQFKGADLSNVNFYGATLEGADLREANLVQLNFWRLPTVWVGSLVHDCRYSPDGSWLAVSTDEGQIKLYQAKTLKLERTLDGHSAAVVRLSFSSDSKLLASADKDHNVMIWDIKHKALLSELVGHTDAVMNVKFLKNSELLASGSADGRAMLWNLQSEKFSQIQGPSAVLALDALPNNELLVSWAGMGALRWDGVVQEPSYFCKNTHQIQSMKVSSDGKFLVLGAFNKVELWSLEKQKRLGIFEGHHDRVNALEFSPDGEFLATASEDETIRLWNLRSVLASGKEFSVAVSKDGSPMLALKEEESIALSQSQTQTASPEGEPLASVSGNGVLRMCGRLSADSYVQLKGYRKGAWGMSFSPDGKVLALSGNNQVVLWNFSGWREGVYSDPDLFQAEPSVKGMGIKDAKGLDPINRHFLQQKGATGNPKPLELGAQCI
ncbi:WD40 repeat domain-containing protein [Mycoavidus cysteinexigens]|nr:WD40 repeat domain-containing protein [Mycoavidus cysteinexigens]